MKKLFYIFLLLGSTYVFAQNKGMTYQAVIYAPGGQNVPGVNVTNAPMPNRTICLQFSFIDATSGLEYQEEVKTKTDEFGMVNITIGKGTQTGGYASSFSSIVWSATSDKSLKVALDATGLCSQYEELSVDKLESVPFANVAITAGNVTGVVAIANGGTGATTAAGARTNLGIGNVDNTADLNKPMSTATKAYVDSQIVNSTIADATTTTKGKLQLAGDLAGTAAAPTVPGLALKENAANKSISTTLGTSNDLFPTQNAVKTYVDTAIAGATIVDADANTKGKIQLNGDLGGTASIPTVPGLALKEDAANKSSVATLGTSDLLYPTQKAVKTYVDTAIAGATIVDADANTKGKIQLNGDLTGTAGLPVIKPNAITTTKVADNAITDAKITTVSGNKITGNISGNATNVSGVVSILNGGTNAITASDARTNLGLGSAATNNTNDFETPLTFSNPLVRTVNTVAIAPATASVNGYLTANDFNTFSNKIDRTEKAANNGVATLGNDGKIPSSQIPAISFQSVNVVASESAMIANSAAQVGSITIRTDVNKNYVLGALPASVVSNWIELSTPTSVTTVNGYAGPNVSLTKSDIVLGNVDNTSDINKPVSTAAQTALNLKANTADVTTSLGLKEDINNKSVATDLGSTNPSDQLYPSQKAVKAYVDQQSANAGVADGSISSAKIANGTIVNADVSPTAAIDFAKLNIQKADVLGLGILKSDLGLGNVDNTSDANKSVSTATQTALDLKANLASPTFTGTVSGIDKTMVGLANVDNTTDAAKPVSTATQTALNLKANAADVTTSLALKENAANKSTSATLGTSDVLFPTQNAVKTYVDTAIAGASIVDADANTKGKLKLAGDLGGTADVPTVPGLALKANLASPTFTGTVSGIDKTMVGLGNVDNTSDVNKPVSTATQTALDLKANLASPTFTGTVSGIDKTMVGLGNVDNTSDSNKPVSTATQTALNLKANAADVTTSLALKEDTANKSISTTLGTSDVLFPTQNAVKTYVDTAISGSTALAVPYTGATGPVNLGAYDLSVNGLRIGKGAGSGNYYQNTALGYNVLAYNSTGEGNTVVGYRGLESNLTGIGNSSFGFQTSLFNTTGNFNSAFGYQALQVNTGSNNIAVGTNTMYRSQSAEGNVAIGNFVLDESNGSSNNTIVGNSSMANVGNASYNVVLGNYAGSGNTNGTYNALIGYGTNTASTGLTNATAIGNGAIVNASNTIQLGNTSVTAVNTSGVITSAAGISATQLTSTVATGTAPLVVTSTTPVANLNIGGNAANVTGTVAIANGGTGATTAAAALTNLGAEPTTNKSTATDLGNTTPSDQLFPSQKAVKTYVDAQTAAAGVSDGSITSAKILDGTIAAIDIADNTITGAKLVNNLYAAGKTFTFQDLLIGAGTTFGKISTDGSKYISFQPTYNVESTRFWANGNVTIQHAGTFTDNGYTLEVGGTTKFGGNSLISGLLTTGAVTYPNTDGTAGQVLTTNGSGTVSFTSIPSANLASGVTGTLPVSNGGTGLTSLTAGYIPFGNGTSAFGNSSNLFWDSTNSRLGIGTSSPSTKLEVNGSFKAGGLTYPTADGTVGQYLQTDGSGALGFTSLITVPSYSVTIRDAGTFTNGSLILNTSSGTIQASVPDNSNVTTNSISNSTGNAGFGQPSFSSATQQNVYVQTFTTTSAVNLVSISLNAYVLNSPATAIVKVFNDSDPSDGLTNEIATVSKDISSTSNSNMETFTLATSYQTTTNATYTFVIYGTNSSNSFYTGAYSSDNYSGGTYYTSQANTNYNAGSNLSSIGLTNFNSNDLKFNVNYATGSTSSKWVDLLSTVDLTTSVSGSLPIANGGTGATTAAGARTNLGLGNVDNTSDLNKPISTATQAALDLKQNALTNPITGTGTSNKLAKFSGTSTLTDSNITDNGTVVSIATDATVNGLTLGRGLGGLDTNTVFGLNALANNTSGNNNTAIGFQALRLNSTGSNNAALGRDALYNNTTGGANMAFGKSALLNNLTGGGNIAVGFDALLNNLTGYNNVAIGISAGADASSGTMTSTNNSIYLGALSKGLNATGSTNEIVIGNAAIGLGSNSTVIGNNTSTKAAIYGALNLPNTTTSTTATTGALTVGGGAGIAENLNVGGNAKITGTLTIAGGTPGAGKVLTSDANGLGTWSSIPTTNMASGVTGILPLANGGTGSATQNFVDLTTDQTIAGVKTLSSDIVVNGINIGRGKGAVATNTAVGTGAISAIATGADNTAMGYNALKAVTSGSGNISIGSQAAKALTTGTDNTTLGYRALSTVTSSQSNTAIGNDALRLLGDTTNDRNTAVGTGSFANLTTGQYNVGVGMGSLLNATSGSNNVALGKYAGFRATNDSGVSTSNKSIFIGSETKPMNPTSDNEIVIGYAAVGLGNNSTVIGNSSITQAKVFGALNLPSTTTSTTATTGALTVGGGVGIVENLNVGGDAKITGTLTVTSGAGAGKVLTSDANGLGSWTSPIGVTTLAAIGSTPNVNGATISGTTLNLEPASATYGGVVTTGAQTFAGAKTFGSIINVSPSTATIGAGSSSAIAAQNGFTNSNGGALNLIAGNGNGSGNGGDINLNPGTTSTGTAGKVIVNGSDMVVNTITIGLGKNSFISNTALGTSVLSSISSGVLNTGVGYYSLKSNTTGSNNTGLGYQSLGLNSTGIDNTAFGANAGDKLTTGAKNIFVGSLAGSKIATGTTSNTTGANSVLIGYDVRPAADGETNEIVISGYTGSGIGMIGKGSNTTTIGNSATTDTYINGNLNLTGQIKLTNAVLSKSDTYAFATTDNANLLVYSGTTAGKTITLPVASAANTGREITIKNIGTVSLTIASAGGYLISDSSTTTAATLAIGIEPSNNWIKAISDGTNWIILRALF